MSVRHDCPSRPGHTDYDLIVLFCSPQPVVFCGDLVEESGDPVIDPDSDIGAWPGTLIGHVAGGAHVASCSGTRRDGRRGFCPRQRSPAQRV